MNRFAFLAVLMLVILTLPALADDFDRQSNLVTDIYQPSSVSPEKLKSILMPLYSGDSIFSSDNRQLIIRAPQPTLNEIQSLLLQLDHPARTFKVQFSHRNEDEPQLRRYSTEPRSNYLQNFSMLENSSLIVVDEHEDQEVSEVSPFWFRVNHIPTKGRYLNLEMQTAGDFVYLSINRRMLEYGKLQEVNQQINGPIGQWLRLSEVDGYYDQGNSRRWLSRRDRNVQLYIKVEPED
jgi:hypothetical protein